MPLATDMLRVRSLVLARIEQVLLETGLTEPKWRIIHALATGPETGTGALGRRVFLVKPTLTRMLNEMEATGWVSRNTHPADRRVALVRLTEEGQAIYDRIAPRLEDTEKSVRSMVGEDLLDDLDAMLTTLERKFSKR